MTLRAEIDRLTAVRPTAQDIADLLTLAEQSADADPWDWADLKTLLIRENAFEKREAAQVVQRIKITAALGSYPYTPSDLIPLWLKANGYRIQFGGGILKGQAAHDDNYVVQQINEWCATYAGSQRAPLFSPSLIRGAFENHKTDNRREVTRRAYEVVKYDSEADTGELDRLAALLTHDDPLAPMSHPDRIRVTAIAIKNFIYRIKNHMRGQWRHSCHLMPIFHGPQGSSKTTAIDALLAPIEEVVSRTDFSVFGHDAKEFDLTVYPVMFFDEMSGASRADWTKIKQVMTQRDRTVRQIYQGTSNRTLVTTFIGASNKDISTLIRDDTGARRFIQIATPRLSRQEVMTAFDMTAIWRSVDEDAAEPPQYADEETIALMARAIAGQRFKGAVEEWLESDELPSGAVEYKTVFSAYYLPWLENHRPGEVRFASAADLKTELKRLIDAGDAPTVTHTRPKGYDHFRFGDGAVVPVRRPAEQFLRA